MKLFVRFAFALTALALLASQPARADVYGYIDENGLAHFAAERLDDRYVLFMKGAAVASKGDDKAKDDSAIALPATELPDADAYLNASKRDALDNAAGMRQRLVRVSSTTRAGEVGSTKCHCWNLKSPSNSESCPAPSR